MGGRQKESQIGHRVVTGKIQGESQVRHGSHSWDAGGISDGRWQEWHTGHENHTEQTALLLLQQQDINSDLVSLL